MCSGYQQKSDPYLEQFPGGREAFLNRTSRRKCEYLSSREIRVVDPETQKAVSVQTYGMKNNGSPKRTMIVTVFFLFCSLLPGG